MACPHFAVGDSLYTSAIHRHGVAARFGRVWRLLLNSTGGLRASEIVAICLEDIGWRPCILHGHQRKISLPLELPLTRKAFFRVGEASEANSAAGPITKSISGHLGSTGAVETCIRYVPAPPIHRRASPMPTAITEDLELRRGSSGCSSMAEIYPGAQMLLPSY